jgi:hypothetical protein
MSKNGLLFVSSYDGNLKFKYGSFKDDLMDEFNLSLSSSENYSSLNSDFNNLNVASLRFDEPPLKKFLFILDPFRGRVSGRFDIKLSMRFDRLLSYGEGDFEISIFKSFSGDTNSGLEPRIHFCIYKPN